MAKKRVLIVVDYQKDFVDWALGFESAKNLDNGIASLMKEYAEDENGLIFCTFEIFSHCCTVPDKINLPNNFLADFESWSML